MAMIYSSIFSSNFFNLQPSTNPIAQITSFPPYNPIKSHNHFYAHRRNFRLPKVASVPYPPINVDYLETEFSGHGVSFTSLGESCVVRMGLDNGSVATLMLPSGLITSYKAPMWHGGLLELLHTTVSEGEDGGAAVIRGGVSLAFRCECGHENGGSSWSPTTWALSRVRGSPQETIQVELIGSNSEDNIEVKHIVTLEQDVVSSEIVITNLRPSSIWLTGSIISHLAVSTPEATYAVGLERANYFVKPPVFSNFSIVPLDFNNSDSGSRDSWGPTAFKQLLSGWWPANPNSGSGGDDDDDGKSAKTRRQDEEMEGEEVDDYKHLTEKLSMIYTSAPRSFTIIDRGRRNSVIVGREGFNELYIFSPGSSHEPYGKYSYVCIGQAALLEPVTVGPESEWRGVQHLHNPNL